MDDCGREGWRWTDTRLVIGAITPPPFHPRGEEKEAPLKRQSLCIPTDRPTDTTIQPKSERTSERKCSKPTDRLIYPPSCPKDRNAVAFTEAAPPPSGHRHGVPLLSRSWIVKFESRGAKQLDDTKTRVELINRLNR